jgi:hypothetical protein
VRPRASPVVSSACGDPLGGLPPPFPTTLPPQGDPERVVGNGSGKVAEAGGRGRDHRGTLPQQPQGSPMISPPHPHFLTPPGPPDGPRYAGQNTC